MWELIKKKNSKLTNTKFIGKPTEYSITYTKIQFNFNLIYNTNFNLEFNMMCKFIKIMLKINKYKV